MTEREMRFLRSVVDSLRTSIEKNSDAIQKQSRAQNNPSQPPPQPVIKSEVSLPPAVQAYYESEQDERRSNNRWERIKRFIEVVAFFAALAAAFFTYKTLKQVERQAGAAQKQVVIALSDQRAWISANFTITRKLSMDGNIVSLDYGITLNNTGHSPALNVRKRSDLVMREIKTLSQAATATIDASTCPISDPSKSGLAIFPGERQPVNPNTLVKVDIGDIDKRPGSFYFTLNTCIDYTISSSATSAEHHQTLYINAVATSGTPARPSRMTLLEFESPGKPILLNDGEAFIVSSVLAN